MALLWILLWFVCICLWLWHLNRNYALTSLTRRVKTVDGSPIEKMVDVACGFWGNTFDIITMDLEEYFEYSCKFVKRFQRSYVKYLIRTPIYCVVDVADAELVLTDSRLLTKSKPYRYLQIFMNTGLVTSTDQKWHTCRRLLTPTFHFHILQQFMGVFNLYQKRRCAMLDTLLLAEKDGLIDHDGICEEVDTFISAGLDTTSIHLIFVFMCLSLYPAMQQKCYEEIRENIGDDFKDLDMQKLQKLKYIDCFLKETHRLFPTAPFVARQCTSDIALTNNLLLPKGTQIVVDIYHIHRSNKYYKEPEIFRPERFMSPEVDGRHAYAFIPFSAGQRNCIGQKFATLEAKTCLVHVLKHFILEPVTQPQSLRFSAGILLRTKTNVKTKISKRN